MKSHTNYLAPLALSLFCLSAAAASAEPRAATDRTPNPSKQSETVVPFPADLMGTSLRRPQPMAPEHPSFIPRNDSWMFRDSDNNNG